MTQGNSQMTQDRSLLGEKELLYVKDMLSWELLAIKKCNDAANRCEDQQMAGFIREIGQTHQKHYDSLLNQLS